jgi:hypothetical protein
MDRKHDKNDPKVRDVNNPGRDIDRDERKDANRDPITGTPGAHPVGVGAGAAAGGLAGGAVGSLAGPAGTVIGAAVGGIAGGLGGKAAAEAVNPTDEDAYWRENWNKRDYADKNRSYNDYAPAYRYGWESCCANAPAGRSFDQSEPEMSRHWSTQRGSSPLSWNEAKPACRDAWSRVESRVGKK